MAGQRRTLAPRNRHRVDPLVTAGVVVALGFLVLGGCVSTGSSSTPRPTTGVTGVSAAPSAPVATPVAPTTPTPAPWPGTPAAAPIVVTAADNGTILQLAVGQQFLLDLGSSMNWAVTVADQNVVGRVPGVLVVRGAQGIYVARATGTTLLSAVGSPQCTSGACPLFRIGFRLTITVG